MAFTECNSYWRLSPLRKSWTRKRSCLLSPWNKYKKESSRILQRFLCQSFSFDTKLIVAFLQTPLLSGKIDIHSDEFNLECGMPQGSCLGPILFTLCSVGSFSKLISLAPVPGKPISANRGLNIANHRINFIPWLDSVPESTINLNLGIN